MAVFGPHVPSRLAATAAEPEPLIGRLEIRSGSCHGPPALDEASTEGRAIEKRHLAMNASVEHCGLDS